MSVITYVLMSVWKRNFFKYKIARCLIVSNVLFVLNVKSYLCVLVKRACIVGLIRLTFLFIFKYILNPRKMRWYIWIFFLRCSSYLNLICFNIGKTKTALHHQSPLSLAILLPILYSSSSARFYLNTSHLIKLNILSFLRYSSLLHLFCSATFCLKFWMALLFEGWNKLSGSPPVLIVSLIMTLGYKLDSYLKSFSFIILVRFSVCIRCLFITI